MAFFVAWMLVLVPAAFACWCFAAFILRWREEGRLLAATLGPAAAVACYLYADYLSKRVPPAEQGWDIFFAIVCVVAGAFTLIATLPVYWLTERHLGGRAP